MYRWDGVYRCAGVGPAGNSAQRKSCGNRVKLGTLDKEIWREFAEHNEPEVVDTIIPGSDYAEDIAAVQLAIRDLDALADDYDDRHAALLAELRHLRSLPAQPERRSSMYTGRTEGDAFKVMTEPEQRAFIRLWTLTVWPDDSEDPRALAAALMGRRWTLVRKA